VLKKGKKGKKRCVRKPKPAPEVSTPVKVDLLPGSYATVDIPAVPLPGGYVIPGMPVTRTLPISGRLKGNIPGGYEIGKDNPVNLTEMNVAIGASDILSDPGCGGAGTLRLNPASKAMLDTATPSVGMVLQTAKVTSSVHALMRLAFDSRTQAGCDAPLVTMGSAETVLPVTLEGMIEKATGLTALTMDGPSVPLSVAVCLTPGAADQPCTTPPVAYPATIDIHVIVKIKVGVGAE
jgi:hypothetical protein